MSIKMKDPESCVMRFLYLASIDQEFYDAFVKHAKKKLKERKSEKAEFIEEHKVKSAKVSFDNGTGLTYNGPGTIPGGGGTTGGGS